MPGESPSQVAGNGGKPPAGATQQGPSQATAARALHLSREPACSHLAERLQGRPLAQSPLVP